MTVNKSLPDLTCEVCQKNPAKGVAASTFGPISHAYCQECLEANREVYGTLVAGVLGVERGEVAEWAKPFITATCAFHGKTEDAFWAEVEKLAKEMFGIEPGAPRPPCQTCKGVGLFAIGMTRDICGDCCGTGLQDPADAG